MAELNRPDRVSIVMVAKVARGCGAILSNRKLKKQGWSNGQKMDYDKWVKGKLGRYCEQAARMVHTPKCGRSGGEQKKDAKRKYPKCVPTCKSHTDDRLSKGQRAGAVRRKQSESG